MNPEPNPDRPIYICVDSQKRYHHAALDVGKEYLARFFNRQDDARQRTADELQVQRERLGRTKPASGIVGGLFDRAAMDFNVVMSMGDAGIVGWCRRDAEAAGTKYASALAENPSPEIRCPSGAPVGRDTPDGGQPRRRPARVRWPQNPEPSSSRISSGCLKPRTMTSADLAPDSPPFHHMRASMFCKEQWLGRSETFRFRIQRSQSSVSA
jgi:hypothetical protein